MILRQARLIVGPLSHELRLLPYLSTPSGDNSSNNNLGRSLISYGFFTACFYSVDVFWRTTRPPVSLVQGEREMTMSFCRLAVFVWKIPKEVPRGAGMTTEHGSSAGQSLIASPREQELLTIMRLLHLTPRLQHGISLFLRDAPWICHGHR